jgi:hypothetical protein
MLPADHAERVRLLSLRLYDAPDGRNGRRALLEVKADASISREYGRSVMFDAIRNLFTTLLEHGTPIEVAVIGSRLPEYINAARSPLATDYLPGWQDASSLGSAVGRHDPRVAGSVLISAPQSPSACDEFGLSFVD